MTLNPPDDLPKPGIIPPSRFCGVAFKEWAGVCAALLDGRQSLILRKGGVAESNGEFYPDHSAFWLYPTVVHQAEQGLRTPLELTSFDPSVVPIEALTVVEWTGRVERLEQLAALAPFHDWTKSTIRSRFDYRRPGLWALVVRIYRRRQVWPLTVTAEQLGCKTWVPLDPMIPTDEVDPVLEAVEVIQRIAAIQRALRVEI